MQQALPFPLKPNEHHAIPDLTAASRYLISPTPRGVLGKRAQKASLPIHGLQGECSRATAQTQGRSGKCNRSGLVPSHQNRSRRACPGQGPRASHLWDVVIVLIITFVIRNGRRVGVWARGDEILIAEFYFIMTGSVTIVFCNRAQ